MLKSNWLGYGLVVRTSSLATALNARIDYWRIIVIEKAATGQQ